MNPAVKTYVKERAYEYQHLKQGELEKELLDVKHQNDVEAIEYFCNYTHDDSGEYIQLYERLISL